VKEGDEKSLVSSIINRGRGNASSIMMIIATKMSIQRQDNHTSQRRHYKGRGNHTSHRSCHKDRAITNIIVQWQITSKAHKL